MGTYRVLWVDEQMGGRWQDVDAVDEAHATWQTASVVGQGTTFVAVAEISASPE